MKSFLKNNVHLIYNISLIILLFTYPITNTSEINKQKIDNKIDRILKIKVSNIENGTDIYLRNSDQFIVKPISIKADIFQASNILFTKNYLYKPIVNP